MELKHIILFSLELFILLSAALLSTAYLLYKLKNKQKSKNFSHNSDSAIKNEAPLFDNVFHEVVPASAIIKKQISRRETGLTSPSEKPI